ncbi:MAG: hypothetical protein L7F77_04865 [Candidatus Magnetominusculus sp. LBB02]|nr:hypothetical protein [Candidatus Magnetominusculus sp. LBB02]
MAKKQYKDAYNCLEELLSEFPDDEYLCHCIIDLTFVEMQSYDLARKWLQKSLSMRQIWLYYAMLSEVELSYGMIETARELYQTAVSLKKNQKKIFESIDSKAIFASLLRRIRIAEWNRLPSKAIVLVQRELDKSDSQLRYYESSYALKYPA